MRISLDVSAVPPQPAGAGRYIFELARGLAHRNSVDTTLLARRSDAFRWEALGERSRVLSIVPDMRPARLVWEQLVLPARLRRERVAVHHAPHYTMPEHASVPTVVTIHDMTLFDHPEWHERAKVLVFRRAITRAVHRADHLIAVSNDTAQRVRERFGDVDMTVIPHGIDHARFHALASADDKAILEAADVPPKYIASIGTIEPRKNLPLLIRAFDAIAGEFPDLHLVIAGQRGWLLDEFDAALAAARYGERITVTGYVSEALVAPLLRNAQAVAYPSHVEGFGLPALEALACGAPLVAAKGSAVEEVVGDAAVLVDSTDEHALADGLRTALRADRALAAQNGPVVAAAYTWDAVVNAHLDVYRRVAGLSAT